jgi:hypothetical protein
MTARQRQSLLGLLQGEHTLHAYEHALVVRRSAAPVRLETLDVLEALCATVLASPAYPDRRLRVALCNILLQRVQAMAAAYQIPVDKFIKDLQKRNGINELYDQIAHEKVLVFLENNAVITDVPAAEAKPA